MGITTFSHACVLSQEQTQLKGVSLPLKLLWYCCLTWNSGFKAPKGGEKKMRTHRAIGVNKTKKYEPHVSNTVKQAAMRKQIFCIRAFSGQCLSRHMEIYLQTWQDEKRTWKRAHFLHEKQSQSGMSIAFWCIRWHLLEVFKLEWNSFPAPVETTLDRQIYD